MIFSSFVGQREVSSACKFLRENLFPNFETPSRGLLAVSKVLKYKQFPYLKLQKKIKFDKKAVQKINQEISTKKGVLSYTLSKKIFDVFSISLPFKKIIESENDIDNAELERDKKYVLKVDCKKIVHKKEKGFVIENITCENFKESANSLFSKCENLNLEFTLTLEEMHEGYEVAAGLLHDESLGDFVLFGTGGTYISLYRDIVFSPAPLTKTSAKILMESTKMIEILKGYRESFSVNLELLEEVLVKLSVLRSAFPQIKEIDLNPIICLKDKLYLVDVKIIV